MVGAKFPLVFMALAMVAACVLGDDTEALQDTLSSLCSLNQFGKFGSCCKSHNISSLDFENRDTWECFFYNLEYTTGNLLTVLDFYTEELTLMGDGVFSSLSHLECLNFIGNELRSLPNDTFAGLSTVFSLNIAENSLTVITTEVFTELTRISSLCVSLS